MTFAGRRKVSQLLLLKALAERTLEPARRGRRRAAGAVRSRHVLHADKLAHAEANDVRRDDILLSVPAEAPCDRYDERPSFPAVLYFHRHPK